MNAAYDLLKYLTYLGSRVVSFISEELKLKIGPWNEFFVNSVGLDQRTCSKFAMPKSYTFWYRPNRKRL